MLSDDTKGMSVHKDDAAMIASGTLRLYLLNAIHPVFFFGKAQGLETM
jgi:hypothetical protein